MKTKASISSALGIIILAALTVPVCMGQKQAQIDTSKTAVIGPFETTQKGAIGLPEATRTAVIAYLKDDGMFPAVLTTEEAKDVEKESTIGIAATLSEFKAGNRATRVLVGLGSGRASATWDFTVTDGATGDVVWQRTIKEKASFWGNTDTSREQRGVLPEKVAKTLVKQLNKVTAK